jgi:hypothetical protein
MYLGAAGGCRAPLRLIKRVNAPAVKPKSMNMKT